MSLTNPQGIIGILRPRIESPLTQHDRHAYRLVRDLFSHRESIFGELKRTSTLNSRARAISTDESQRRAHVEARNRAVISSARSRPSSPAPSGRHRRDISGDMSATRFPISTGSPPSGATISPVTRYRPQSLEVPGGLPTAQINEQLQQHYTQGPANLGFSTDGASMTSEPEQLQDGSDGGIHRSNSLSRSTRPKKQGGAIGLVRTAHANQAASKRESAGEIGVVEGYPGYYGGSSATSSPVQARGVQLSDRPIDD